MNEITIWNFETLEIRTLEIDGEAWFVGRDICSAFRDTNSSRSIGRIDEEDKRTIEITDRMGRKQNAIFVNESGMYALLFAMQPQKSNNDGVSDAYPIEVQERIDRLRDFKRLVTHEVLPSIRRNGSYGIPDNISPTLRVLIEHEKSLQKVVLQVQENEDKIARIRTTLTAPRLNWREEAERITTAIAEKVYHHPWAAAEVKREAYRLLEKRGHCKLQRRLCNLRNKMFWERRPDEEIEKTTELDIIAADKQLREIFINIIREMAVKYDV